MPKLKSYQIYFEGGECRSSHPDAYLGIGVLCVLVQICCKFSEHLFLATDSCRDG